MAKIILEESDGVTPRLIFQEKHQAVELEIASNTVQLFRYDLISAHRYLIYTASYGFPPLTGTRSASFNFLGTQVRVAQQGDLQEYRLTVADWYGVKITLELIGVAADTSRTYELLIHMHLGDLAAFGEQVIAEILEGTNIGVGVARWPVIGPYNAAEARLSQLRAYKTRKIYKRHDHGNGVI